MKLLANTPISLYDPDSDCRRQFGFGYGAAGIGIVGQYSNHYTIQIQIVDDDPDSDTHYTIRIRIVSDDPDSDTMLQALDDAAGTGIVGQHSNITI